MADNELNGTGAYKLNSREMDVLRLVAQGLTNKEIARELQLSQKTIEKMLSNDDDPRAVYRKLGLTSRTAATAWYTTWFGPPADHTNMQILSSPFFLDLIVEQTTLSQQARVHGNPRLSIQLGDSILSKLRKNTRTYSSITSHPLLPKLIAYLCYEQSSARREIIELENVKAHISAVTKEIRTLASVANRDPEIISLANLVAADAYYIYGDHFSSIRWYAKALAGPMSVDNRLIALRNQALNWACVREEAEFERVRIELQRVIDTGNFSNLYFVSQAYEGIARAQGVLRQQNAFDSLEDARRIYVQIINANERVPFRYVQLVRSELDIWSISDLSRNQSSNNKTHLISQWSEALRLALEHGYKRHASRIQKRLGQLFA